MEFEKKSRKIPIHLYLDEEIVHKLEREDNASALVRYLLEQHYESKFDIEIQENKKRLKELKKKIKQDEKKRKAEKRKEKKIIKVANGDVAKIPLYKKKIRTAFELVFNVPFNQDIADKVLEELLKQESKSPQNRLEIVAIMNKYLKGGENNGN